MPALSPANRKAARSRGGSEDASGGVAALCRLDRKPIAGRSEDASDILFQLQRE